MALRIWGLIVLLALAGCASLPSVTLRGESELPLPLDRPLGLRLDERSPRARFDGFDSAYARIALPPTEGPLWIELRSLPLDGGRALVQLLAPPPWRVHQAFAPVLDLLDAQGRVLRSIDADALWETGCAPRGAPPLHWPLALTGVLVDARAEGAALLRVRSSEAAQGLRLRRYCEEGERRWAGQARLELRAVPVGATLEPGAQAYPIGRWRGGASGPDEGLDWGWMLVSGASVRTGLWDGSRAAPGGEPWPAEALLEVRREDPRSGEGFSALMLASPAAPVRQRFHAPAALAERVEALVPAGRLVLWELRFQAMPFDAPVALRFEAEPASPAPDGAMARIRDLAGAGGILVAAPCGVCAAGVCGPEMLGPCAAAFGAGAVIGGAVGLVKEAIALLLPGRKHDKQTEAAREPPPPPPPELVARLGALPARWFPPGALEAAYARDLPELPDGLWLSRPWAALPTVGGGGGGGAPQCGVAVRITAVAFERPARADATAFRVRMEVEHRMVCNGRDIGFDRAAVWSDSYREPEVWLDPSSAETQHDLDLMEARITAIGLRWAEARWGGLVRGLDTRPGGR